jgi:signal transduction histidine kinase
VKHAKTEKVEIVVSLYEDVLSIEIEDFGCGMVQEDESGNGLKNVKYRVEKCSAALTIESVIGKGTKIKFHKLKLDINPNIDD